MEHLGWLIWVEYLGWRRMQRAQGPHAQAQRGVQWRARRPLSLPRCLPGRSAGGRGRRLCAAAMQARQAAGEGESERELRVHVCPCKGREAIFLTRGQRADQF